MASRATAAQRRSARARRRNTGSDFTARVAVAIPAIGFAIAILAFGGTVFAAGAALLGLVCLHELFRLYAALRPVRLAAFLGLLGLAAAALYGGERQVLLAAVACVPLTFVLALVLPARSGSTITEGIAITLLGTFWIGLSVAHAILLEGTPHGAAVIVDLLVGTFVGDTGAYLGGRAFGTRALAPRVSPHKTVEGLIVGAITAVVATWCAGLYQDWLTHGQALLLGLTVAVAAPLGDLFESKVKRDAGAKDTGSLFGAHGGALDRLDAAFFALVAGYYVWLAIV